MLLAKPARKNPRELAQAIVDQFPVSGRVAKLEIAGPGFYQFLSEHGWLSSQISAIVTSPTLNVAPAEQPQTIVVDYSAPMLRRKCMSVIRSTIIGDSVAKTLEFWGTR